MDPRLTCGFVNAKGVLSTRITSLYGSQPSPVVFACKTETLCPELQVSMGHRPHLSLCACKTAWLSPEFLVSMGPSPHLLSCVFKTATLGPDLQVCMCPRPHLWICAHITVLCMQNSVLTTRIASLNLSQVSSVVFPFKTGTLGPELQVSIGPRPHLSFCACITAWLAPELLVSIGPSTHVRFLDAKQRLMD